MKIKNEEAAGVEPGDLEEANTLANPPDESEQEDFDWQNDPAVILHDQAATAAYFNRHGELVVRQRDTLGYEGTVYITPENIGKFLEGLDARARPIPPKKLRVFDGGGNE